MPLDVWNGSSWVDAKAVSVWNGSSWVAAKSVKVWDGNSWELAWPISTTISVTSSLSWTLSHLSGTETGYVQASPTSRSTPQFTVSVGTPTSLSKVEFQLSYEGGGWTTYQTWTTPTASMTHGVNFNTAGAWKYRALGTYTSGGTVVSSEGSITCAIKDLDVYMSSGTTTPEVGTSVSIQAAASPRSTAHNQTSSTWYYRTTNLGDGSATGWINHGVSGSLLTWQNGGTTPHEWLYQEGGFPDGTSLNSSSIIISPEVGGLPITPGDTEIRVSRRYSMSDANVTAIHTYEQVYLSVYCGANQIVEWVYRTRPTSSGTWGPWAVYGTRKSRGSASPDSGYGGWAKTCTYINSTADLTYEFAGRWGGTTSAAATLRVYPLNSGSWDTPMAALNSRINADYAMYNRETGTVTGGGANDGDTFNWTPSTGLKYSLGPDGNGAYLPVGYAGEVANRYLGIQAPEYSASSGKDWQWGKSSWRRNVEHVPLGQWVQMQSRWPPDNKGYDSSRGDGNFRTCRAVVVPDLNNVDVCDVLVDEGLAKPYMQRSSMEMDRANSMCARAERASYAGLALYRNSHGKGNWGITWVYHGTDSEYIYFTNNSTATHDVSDWWFSDAAGVTHNYQIKEFITNASLRVMAPGDQIRIDSPNGMISNADGGTRFETLWLHTNQADNEPDEVVAWCRRLEGSTSVVQIPMNVLNR